MPGGTPLNVEQAAECLRQGRVIAYPTEAAYGLGKRQPPREIGDLPSDPVQRAA